MNNMTFWNDVILRSSPPWNPGQPLNMGSYPIVAGGCLRDYVLGLPHNDIDVFIPHSPYATQEDLPPEPRGFTYIRTLTREEYPGANTIFRVYEYEYQDETVQIIHLPGSFEEHFTHFDYNMTRLFYKYREGLTMDPAFLRGLADKKIRNWTGVENSPRMQAFLDKVSAHEQGWEIERMFGELVFP